MENENTESESENGNLNELKLSESSIDSVCSFEVSYKPTNFKLRCTLDKLDKKNEIVVRIRRQSHLAFPSTGSLRHFAVSRSKRVNFPLNIVLVWKTHEEEKKIEKR